MSWLFQRQQRTTYIVQVDAAMAANGSAVGLGVLIRGPQGKILQWASRRIAESMTNNEAEYAALCFALELLADDQPDVLHIYSDSEIAVNQMRGHFRVNSADLRTWHHKACQLARHFPTVTYTHIPRERNQLADALANEALQPALPRARSGDDR